MVDDDDDFDEGGEDESQGGLSGPKDNLRGAALDKAVREEGGTRAKSSRVGVEDVEEAVASIKKKADHPHPYESGYGRHGTSAIVVPFCFACCRYGHSSASDLHRTRGLLMTSSPRFSYSTTTASYPNLLAR